jgi:cysteine synthase/rhodanese-related sulfurtransferase
MAPTPNAFHGPDALARYLNPDEHPNTPLVELPDSLNPYRNRGVLIYAKMMGATPLMNVKSVPAYSMLATAEADGELAGKTDIIENSSGNTVFSLSVIGRVLAGLRTSAYVSHEITAGKLKMLRFFGVSPIVNEEPICPDPADPTSGIYKAKQLAESEAQWFNPGQYDNPANPQAHSGLTGEQLWQQTDGQIGLFCAGLGTTGTMVGTAEVLKRHSAQVQTLGVIRSPNNAVPGPRTANLLRQIAFDWEQFTDTTVEIGTKAAYATSLELCRHGLLVGPSSGFALAGLLEQLEAEGETPFPDAPRNEAGELICAFICCDTPFPYLDEYFEVLEDSQFPKVENAELLIEQRPEMLTQMDNEHSLLPSSAWDTVYGLDVRAAWKDLENGHRIAPKANWLIVDLRPAEHFAHFQLPGSINLPYEKFSVDQLPADYKKRDLLLVCTWGLKSADLCAKLLNHNLRAHSLEGGLTSWSKEQLPRERPAICVSKHPIKHLA